MINWCNLTTNDSHSKNSVWWLNIEDCLYICIIMKCWIPICKYAILCMCKDQNIQNLSTNCWQSSYFTERHMQLSCTFNKVLVECKTVLKWLIDCRPKVKKYVARKHSYVFVLMHSIFMNSKTSNVTSARETHGCLFKKTK